MVVLFFREDWPSDDGVDLLPVCQEADVVIEDSPGVEERDGEADSLADGPLKAPEERLLRGDELVIEIVLAKGQDGDDACVLADGEFEEAPAPPEDEGHCTRDGFEGFAGAADYDRDCTAAAREGLWRRRGGGGAEELREPGGGGRGLGPTFAAEEGFAAAAADGRETHF